MAGLRLGPLLRYVDGAAATVWVEADRPCAAEVRCADGSKGETPTFQVGGHHYALIPVAGLTPGTETAYEVLLDGHRVWPLDDSPFPAPTIRTPAEPAAEVRVSFGSCRWAISPTGEKDPMGPDALDTLAVRLAADPDAERPDVLILLGDQVYADMTSPATKRWLAERRDLSRPPGDEVADYEEYTHLYDESWLDPEVRWLLSTVPSCMIFDDHDVIDDWNTSAAWLAEMRAEPWWNERVLSGLMSYWVYQHLGNLTPDELDADPVYAAVRGTPDGTDALRAFAAGADADPASARWSYRRDFGRVRLLMVDTRAARVLEESRRAMLDAGEERWLREQALDAPGSYDHLLIGTSLPWLLPHLVHEAEGWNAALARGERGPRWARFAEDLRRRSDLEHWPAFPASFAALTDLIARAGSGPDAPASVCVLSGDVHHAYIAEPTWPQDEGPRADVRVLQLTCSPMHNSIHVAIKLGFRFGWSRLGRALGRRFARHGRTERAAVNWRRTGGPWFGNHLMTLTLRGRSGRLSLDRARAVRGGGARLERVRDSVIST
ncbi:alkaline phosphatase D family protein [Streptomyces boluensis]|uniref:Alkaline phosphatase family protein n=1 Tax=Streptomyces boluensis TaxID=1775135 RepID=A0A964UWC6_9ACTN|nr:alkaline phosphatase D family protein [Streptomyces boluensis]NBE55468.1 alkaline phosphatase family protein [Streptomyces boluensis]